jgi:hypothetical protein
MKLRSYISLYVLITILTGNIAAQELSSYNLSILPQRRYQNPAFIPVNKSYIGIPVLSSIAFNFSNNGFSYSDLVINQRNKPLTLNIEGMMKNLKNKNHISLSFESDLIAAGIKSGKYFIGFNVTEKVNMDVFYSRQLINFICYGNAPSAGTIQNFNPKGEANHYREYDFSIAKELKKNFTAGIKLKYINGFEHIDNSGTGLNIYTDPDDYSIGMNADMIVHTAGLSENPEYSVGGSNTNNKKNFGYGIDIGFYYKPLTTLEISGSLLDAGLIRWSSDINTYECKTENSSFVYSGINLNEFILNDNTSGEDYLEILIDSVYNSMNITESQETFKHNLPRQLFFNISYLITKNYKASFLIKNKKIGNEQINDVQLCFTGFASSKLNYIISANKINNTRITPGAGFTVNIKKMQLYFLTDNVPGLISWKSSTNTGFKAGINLVFGPRLSNNAPQPVLE